MDYQELFQNFITTLITGVLGVLAGFLIALVKKGFDWLNAKIGSIKSDNARKSFQEASEILQAAVVTTVTSLQQEFGDDIRESLANNDGKFTREDLLALKDTAIEIVLNNLNDAVIEILKSYYDNFEDMIGNMVEVQVRALKEKA